MATTQAPSQPPALSPFVRLSTSDGSAKDRFERWRSLYSGVDISVADNNDALRFEGEMRAVTGVQGVIFGMSRYTANLCQFSRRTPDMLLISLTKHGSIGLVRNNRAQALATPADGLVMVQADTGTRSVTQGHGHIYLSLPMELARQAIGGDAMRNDEALRLVGSAPLAPFLIAQLELLGTHLATLDSVAAQAAIATATDLSLAMLRGLRSEHHPAVSLADRSLFDAATLLMSQRHGDPELTATSIAAALGCSRSHLYGVFARLGHTVADHLRTIRMEQACQLLRGTTLTVSMIAFRVGYDSDTAFSRAFRSFYGENPRDYRSRFSNGGA